MHRRSFLQWSIAAAAALGAAGMPRLARGQAPSGQADASVDALVESLAHDPMSLQLLDLLGTINFADAMGGI
jgi:hypothetical protein